MKIKNSCMIVCSTSYSIVKFPLELTPKPESNQFCQSECTLLLILTTILKITNPKICLHHANDLPIIDNRKVGMESFFYSFWILHGEMQCTSYNCIHTMLSDFLNQRKKSNVHHGWDALLFSSNKFKWLTNNYY